jgi:hypothetical protein
VGLFPARFVAYTLNVYTVFVLRPVSVILPDPLVAVEAITPGGVLNAVYDVIASPPLFTGAV